MRPRRIPDLSGSTVGRWHVLYETGFERRRRCMCRCLECGLRRFVMVLSLWRGYAPECSGCKARREELLAG